MMNYGERNFDQYPSTDFVFRARPLTRKRISIEEIRHSQRDLVRASLNLVPDNPHPRKGHDSHLTMLSGPDTLA